MSKLPFIALVASTLSVTALADPPDHAPAWGHRDKGHQSGAEKSRYKHRGYTGTQWVEDYGVASGHCNTEAVLTAVGAVAGGVIGNSVASEGNRAVATIIGAVAGGIIGNRIGDSIDDRDRACMGHSLEIVPIGRTVVWANPTSHVDYELRMVRDLPGGCRVFEYRTSPKGRPQPVTACQSKAGVWQLRS